MSKVAVLLTQPIENNSSSMIRCKGIINALIRNGYEISCYCPHPDVDSKYYGKENGISTNVKVVRYGKENAFKVNNSVAVTSDTTNKKVGIKKFAIMCAYKAFKKFDVFGASLQYLRYSKVILNEIRKCNPDILLTFSDPMTAHMIGGYCRKRLDVKYVQQWGDPLATDTIAKIAQPKWMRYLIEKSLIKKADRICYVSPLTLVEQKALFKSQADKMIFLPTPSVTYDKTDAGDNDKIKIGYFGSYNLIARDIRELYKAACNVSKCELTIVGDSDIELQGTDNVHIVGRVTPDVIEEYVKDTDVLVCLMNSKGNQVPGKVYHYAGSYKEILFIKDGEYGNQIEEFFDKYNRYTFVDNNSKEIEKIIKNYAVNGVPKREPVEEFNADNIAAELLKGL